MRQFSINFLTKFYSSQTGIEKSSEKNHHDFLCQGNSILNIKKGILLRKFLGKNFTNIKLIKTKENVNLFPSTSLKRHHIMTPTIDSIFKGHILRNLNREIKENNEDTKKEINDIISKDQIKDEDILNDNANRLNRNLQRNKFMINELSANSKLMKKIIEIKNKNRKIHEDDLQYLENNLKGLNSEIIYGDKAQFVSVIQEPRIKTQNSEKTSQYYSSDKRNKINLRFTPNVNSMHQFCIPGLRASVRKKFLIRKANKLFPLKTHRVITEELSPDSKFRLIQYKNNKEVSPWKID